MRYRLRTLLLAAALWPLGLCTAWSEWDRRRPAGPFILNDNQQPPSFRLTFTVRDALGVETIIVLVALPIGAAILDYQKSNDD
jgi:hypothetical protein